MVLEEIIEKKLKVMKKGKQIIQKILSKLPDKTAIVVFPDSGSIDNYYGLLYLDNFLQNFHYEKVWIITASNLFEKVVPVLVDSDYKIINMNQEDVDKIITLFSLTSINPAFWVASLSIPNGRKAANLVGIKGLTYEEVFAVGVYKLLFNNFQPKTPIYLGDDPEILKFLNFSQRKRYEK